MVAAVGNHWGCPMSAAEPPAPIWQDDVSGLAVWVNGGLIELSMSDGWSGRMLPSEAEGIPAGFAQAITEAREWVERWDIATGGYREAA